MGRRRHPRPRQGQDLKTYRSKATLLEDVDKLEVRGYIGIEALGRSQTWIRQ